MMHKYFSSSGLSVKWGFLLLFAVIFSSNTIAQDVTYSESFTNGVTYCPGQSQFDNWGVFRGLLDTNVKKFRKVTVKGTFDPIGITCNDPEITKKIAHALRTGTNFSITCNGQPWIITPGNCFTGCSNASVEVELVVGSTGICTCTNPGYIFRPTIGNSNWGGISTATCGGPTQTMEVIFSNPLGNNASVGGLSAPVTSCGSATDSLSASITNQGLNKIGNIPVTCVVSGTLGGIPYNNTYNGTVTDSLNPGVSKNIKFASINTSNGADLNVTVYTAYPTDTFHNDDTLKVRYKNVGTPTGNPTASDVSRCGSGPLSLSASIPSGHIGYWYNSSNQLVGVGNSINSPPLPGGTSDSFYVASAKTSSPVGIGMNPTGTSNPGAGFFAGNMFDMNVTKKITIDSLDIHLNGTHQRKVVIYVKNGSYIGSQTAPSNWTRVGEYLVNGAGLGNPTRLKVNPMEVDPGQYGVYIYASDFMVYTANALQNHADDDVSISGGVAMRDTFATSLGLASWNGKIYYRQMCVSGTKIKVKATAKPLPVGADLGKGSLFKGVYSAGIISQPDIVASPDTISYDIMPPTGYNISNHGTAWNIVSSVAYTTNGTVVPSTMYSYSPPSGSVNGLFRFFPDSLYTDSTIEVTVVVRRTDNNCDSILKRIIFVAPRPKTNFTNTTVCFGDVTDFTNTTTISSGTLDYEWKLGDGTVSIDTDPAKTYGGFGTYQVRLIAITNWGIRDSITKTITVKEIPKADFEFSNACEGDPLNFIEKATLPAGTSTFTWQYGDDTTGNGAVSTHLFANPGIYNARLIVDVNGCTDDITKYVTQAPRSIPSFTFTTLQCDNLNVGFTNSSTPPAFGSVGFEWDFGDGAQSTAVSPLHTFNTFNIFNVKLYGKTDLGCIDSVTQSITLLESPKPVFTNTGVKCTNEAIVFTNSTNTPVGHINTYSWEFGDGKSSTDENPVHVYDAPGNYKITLHAASTNGCEGDNEAMITVDEKPVADFTVNKVCLGEETKLTNNSTISAGTLTYSWDLGNGNMSTATNPVVTYASSQTYNVTLISSSPAGCSDTAMLAAVVSPIPTADIIVASNETGDGKIKFTTSETGMTYLWYFGDGGTSTDQSPVYKYNFPGNWNVRVIVTSPDGCTNTTTTSVFVNPLSTKDVAGLQGISIYPNPSAGSVFIDFSQYTGDKVININITDMLGRMVETGIEINNGKAALNFDNRPAGIYNLEIHTENNVVSTRLIIRK